MPYAHVLTHATCRHASARYGTCITCVGSARRCASAARTIRESKGTHVETTVSSASSCARTARARTRSSACHRGTEKDGITGHLPGSACQRLRRSAVHLSRNPMAGGTMGREVGRHRRRVRPHFSSNPSQGQKPQTRSMLASSPSRKGTER